MTHTAVVRRPAIAAAAVLIALGAPDFVSPPAPAVAQIQPTTRSRFSRDAESEIDFQEGLLQYSRNQLKEAEAKFKSLVQKDPADAEAYYYLGLTQLDQGRPGESIQSFNQSLRLDPTSDEVRAGRATAAIRTHQFDQAEEDLKVLEADPRWDSLSAYLRGQLLYAKGDYRGANKAFKRAKAKGETEALPAEFYEGLTYLQMRELVRARQTFREASIGSDRDPTVAAASRQLDEVLSAQERATKRWDAQLSLAYEYDTNVLLLGTDVADAVGISDEADSRFLLQPRASYTFYRGPKLSAGLQANGFFSWHADLHDFDVASYAGGPFVNYALSKNVIASARYSYNYVDFGHEKFLSRQIVTPQLTVVQPKFGYTSAFYQYQNREFYYTATDPAFDFDGDVHTAGVLQGITLPEIFPDAGQANLELSYRYEVQQTKGDDFDGDFQTVGLVLYTPLPVAKWRADVGAAVTFENYDHPNTLDADDEAREDFEWSVTAGLTRQINKAMALRVDYTYTDSDSNVTTDAGQHPYSFDRHLFGVRMILSY